MSELNFIRYRLERLCRCRQLGALEPWEAQQWTALTRREEELLSDQHELSRPQDRATSSERSA